jgi:iron complex outermembrane receptor protein
VVVTAQKRPENVQEIPTAITAITAEVLETKQIMNAGDLEQVSPSLVSVPSSAASAQLVIRGIGAVNTFSGGDPGVPIHLDGHYLQSPSFILHDMLDVSRVEVLRGPQGTLYGRNAIGGNVNIISNAPTDTFEGRFTVGLGNYSEKDATLIVSGPLAPWLQGRIALSAGSHDGYVENISPRGLVSSVVDDDYVSTRGTLKFIINPDLDATVSAFYYKNDAEPFVYRVLGNPGTVGGPTFASVPASYVNPTNADPLKVRIDSPNIGFDIAKGVFLDVNWTLGSVQLKSLSAAAKTSNYYQIDLDATDAAPKVEYGTESRYETFSQELQASYSSDTLHLVGGLFYYHESSEFYRYFSAPPAVYGVGYAYYYNPVPHLAEDSYGIYINGDFDLTDRLKITAGARYSSDDKSMLRGYEVRINGVSLGNTIDSQSKKWTKPTGRVAVTYKLTDDINVFGSIAMGYKAGGFNAVGTTQPPYNPETAINYEFGVKAELLDRRLRLNLDVFQSNYSDKQELVIAAGAGALNEVTIKNSGGATLKGVELESEAVVGEYVTLDASVAYLDATYDSLTSSDPLRPLLGVINLEGNTIPYAPKWKLAVGATVKLPLSEDLGVSTVNIAYSWTDSLYSSFYNRRGASMMTFPNDYIPSRDLLNVSANWVAPSEKWRVFGYVRNVMNSIDPISTGPSYHGLQATNFTFPRTYGVRVTRVF